jgi:hypothetical protein
MFISLFPLVTLFVPRALIEVLFSLYIIVTSSFRPARLQDGSRAMEISRISNPKQPSELFGVDRWGTCACTRACACMRQRSSLKYTERTHPHT